MEVSTHDNQYDFQQKVTLFDAVMLVMGVMIGSGIFLTSAEITRTLGGAGWLMLVWALGGIMTVIGAMSYAELSALFPKAGGQYVYLREAYSPFVAFLYGWAYFTVIECGTIAAVAVAFATYWGVLFPSLDASHVVFSLGGFGISPMQLIAIGSIVLLSYINTRGINGGRWIQSIFTSAKIIALIVLIGFGWMYFNNEVLDANWGNAWNTFQFSAEEGSNPIATSWNIWELSAWIGVAMVGSLFSSDAWNSISAIASEVKNPRKNIARSLLWGTLCVTLLYLLCNLVYISVLPTDAIAQASYSRVAAAAANSIFGNSGARAIAVLILLSTFGCNNGLILSGARVYYSMAKDGLFLKSAGKLNKKGVPSNAIGLQCIWASLLCLSGTYSDLLNYVIFIVLLFYILTIVGIFILRRKLPTMERSYKVPLYPYLPVLYCLMALAVACSLFIFRPLYTWPGLIIVSIGIPLYFMFKSTRRRKEN